MSCATEDSWVATARGRLRLRRWVPAAGAALAPIVLFHESLGCIQLWRGFPAALADRTGRAVIAYDRLGFGQSDRRCDVLATDFIEDEARCFFPAVRRHLGGRRFVAFGHSVGGAMAVHCAAASDGACEALITEGAQAFVDDRIRDGIVAAKRQFAQPDRMQRLERYHGDKARWVLDAWTETWLSPGFAAWSLRDVLPGVRCPTLVLHGRNDEYGAAEHAETIARLVGGTADLDLLPDAGHVPHREDEGAVVERVARFLAEAPSPAAERIFAISRKGG